MHSLSHRERARERGYNAGVPRRREAFELPFAGADLIRDDFKLTPQ